ncbi:MAG: hypothetical protein ACRDYB_10600 [Acidimicrobiales bacterium]
MVTQITIVRTPGKRNASLARQRVEAVTARLARPAAAVLEEIADPDQAARRDFRGSPALVFGDQ